MQKAHGLDGGIVCLCLLAVLSAVHELNAQFMSVWAAYQTAPVLMMVLSLSPHNAAAAVAGLLRRVSGNKEVLQRLLVLETQGHHLQDQELE